MQVILDFICCDDFKEDVVSIMLLGYREKIRKSAMRDKSLVHSIFPPLHTVRGSPFFLQLSLIRPSQRLGPRDESLSLSKTTHEFCMFHLQESLVCWSQIMEGQIIFPKPSHALPAMKKKMFESISFLRCQQTCLLGMIASLSWGEENA